MQLRHPSQVEGRAREGGAERGALSRAVMAQAEGGADALHWLTVADAEYQNRLMTLLIVTGYSLSQAGRQEGIMCMCVCV